MIYGYIRVSTDRQTVDNQRFEIERFCSKNNIRIEQWIEETISGTKSPLSGFVQKTISKLNNGLKKQLAEPNRLKNGF